MHNYWVKSGQVKETRTFSDNLKISIQFPDQQPIQTESDRIDEAKQLLDAGLINKRQAIKKVYPHLDEKTLDAWVEALEGAPTFNGAQIDAMVNVLITAAQGQLPRDSAKGMLIEGFGLKPEKAETVLASIGEKILGNTAEQPQGANGQAPAGGKGPSGFGGSGGGNS
jgi:hypothetical protein